MEIKRGIPVSPGVVIAQVFVLDSEDVRIPRRHFANTTAEVEIDRFIKALTGQGGGSRIIGDVGGRSDPSGANRVL